MRPVTPLSVIQATVGTVATPGTVTGTAIDLTGTYLPDFTVIASCGAITAGTCTAIVQNAPTDTFASVATLGTLQFAGAAGGTVTQALDVTDLSSRYVRVVAVMSGGTVSGFSSQVIAATRG